MDTKAIRDRAASAVSDIHAFAARAEILSDTVPALCDEIDSLRARAVYLKKRVLALAELEE